MKEKDSSEMGRERTRDRQKKRQREGSRETVQGRDTME